ncbi:DMT family transporter [Aquincola sp. S2]|uniref:DMT family transporter n=1 Tax=Pseudaquabacterium terrae TaxID=2732868 RepID=A0ABX2EIH1_9BURK|nr:DMT family transporter [Aquabacterium terrae]NRF68395.1 DMT family transporter [Aquabacterium terrae]
MTGGASKRDAARGLWLGVLAMAMFGLTLPMTQLAVGSAAAPQLSPLFVTSARAVVAAGLSALLLWTTRAPWPRRAHWPALAIAALGNAIGYPLLLAWSLRHVSSAHAAVITALAPLLTAVAAAIVMRQRARLGFWGCALAGCALVVAYSLLRAAGSGNAGLAPGAVDAVLFVAVLAASIGYVYGARVTPELGAERVICWVTLVALPVTLPVALLNWPAQPVAASAWVGFGYVSLFSMWIGFFAWYRALAIGGALRVSQVQLLQPFFAMGFAWPLLGERIELQSLGFAIAVIATVWLGRRFSASPSPARTVR